MKINLLGQDNTTSFETIGDVNTIGIEGSLITFLDIYRLTPQLKNQPVLLTFSEYDESLMIRNTVYHGEDESEFAYKLRMLDIITARINRSRNLVGGFCAAFITETIEGTTSTRRIGIAFYEFPIHTGPVYENHLPNKGSSFHTILGRIIPPSA